MEWKPKFEGNLKIGEDFMPINISQVEAVAHYKQEIFSFWSDAAMTLNYKAHHWNATI